MNEHESDWDLFTAERTHALVKSAVVVAAVSVVVVAIGAALGIPGAKDTACGMFVGSVVAIVNLRILAYATSRVFADQQVGGILGFLLSFVLLISSAAYVVLSHPTWALGFALGLAVPAGGGILYAVTTFQQSTGDENE